MLKDQKHPHRRKQPTMAQQAADEKAAREEEERRQKVEELLRPFGGLCFWCCRASHDPRGCSAKPKVDMSDFEQQKPARTRSRNASKRTSQSKTTRTPAEQREHRAKSKVAYKTRSRALEANAKAVALEILRVRTEPLAGRAPCGQFSVVQLIEFEFLLDLPSHLSAEQLARAPEAFSNTARQVLSRLVKTVPAKSSSAPFASLAALRFPGEHVESDYFGLHERVVHCEAVVRVLLAHRCADQRRNNPHCEAVQALLPEATLLRILQEAAAKPPRGRREQGLLVDAASTPAASRLALSHNWVDGGYTVEAQVAQTSYGARGINISLKRSQADILEASNLMLASGVPKNMAEMQAFKPSKRPGGICCASTAAKSAAVLNAYHVEEAAEAVLVWVPHLDAGSKRGVSALMGGATGLLKGKGILSPTADDDFYQDALGLEILSQKTGAAVSASSLRMLKRRGAHEYYFVGSDAANDMTGHLGGVIAFVRQDRNCVAIFVNRCLAHITARSLKHMLQAKRPALKIQSQRVSLKRKKARAQGKRDRAAAKRAERAQEQAAGEDEECAEGQEAVEETAPEELPPQLKLLEDAIHIHSLWPEMRQRIQERQLEFCKKISGVPESRWKFWVDALVQKVGATQILRRLLDLWAQVCIRDAVRQGSSAEEAAARVDRLQLCELLLVAAPIEVVEDAIAADEWLHSKFDFDVVAHDELLNWDNLLDGYNGAWILDALEVTSSMLNPGQVDIDQLRAPGAVLSPPADCPLSAITSETLPPLLVDIGSQTMRVRLIIDEVIGATFVSPHLAAVEQRRPGIFYDVHHLLGLHQDIADLFGDAAQPWDYGDIGSLNAEFALALDVAMRYAQNVELEDEALEYIDQSMVAYADYHRPQTLEWWENPAFRFGGLGSLEEDPRSEDHGVWHARYLVEEGKAELLAAVARYCHCTVEALVECLEAVEYRGPLKWLVDSELWDELETFAHAEQEQTLWGCEGVDGLRALVYTHYKPLYASNAWCEELVKEFKNLSHQARAHADSAEIRILHHQVMTRFEQSVSNQPAISQQSASNQPAISQQSASNHIVLTLQSHPRQRRVIGRDFFPLPTRERVARIRIKLGHNRPAAERPKRAPPAEPLTPRVWAGHDGSAETGEDGDEDEEDEDEDENEDDEKDPDQMTVPEMKERLRELRVGGYSGLKKAALLELLKESLKAADEEATHAVELDEADDPAGDDDDEDDASDEKEVLERLRAAPPIERVELSAGRAVSAPSPLPLRCDLPRTCRPGCGMRVCDRSSVLLLGRRAEAQVLPARGEGVGGEGCEAHQGHVPEAERRWHILDRPGVQRRDGQQMEGPRANSADRERAARHRRGVARDLGRPRRRARVARRAARRRSQLNVSGPSARITGK
jgi:hypothetical protein